MSQLDWKVMLSHFPIGMCSMLQVSRELWRTQASLGTTSFRLLCLEPYKSPKTEGVRVSVIPLDG